MKLIIGICAMCSLLSMASQNASIKGKLVPEVALERSYIQEEVKVLIDNDCQEKYADVKEGLYFDFHDLKPGFFYIWIEPQTSYSTSCLRGFLEPGATLYVEMPLAYSCKYNQSKNDKTCPVCKKTK